MFEWFAGVVFEERPALANSGQREGFGLGRDVEAAGLIEFEAER